MNAKIECNGQSIQLSGDLVFASVQQLQTQSKSFKFVEGAAIHIDFTGVTKVDSAALALCVSLKREFERDNSKIHYDNVPTAMLSIAESVGMDQLFS
ncbi:MAG: STAS domain-containing protein [Oceanospirillaceae bacterium]|nr:STAS domain-containing protein [Oceanospirillaceae bacterium]